jgi:DNA-binding winged helix-turn-helix (wHTH) protein
VTRVAFGEFALDTDTRQLLWRGQPAHLSPKAYRLLAILVEDRPKAIAKADLQRRLWPDTFVIEANVANLVGEIRQALRDDPRQPRYLRTVHGFGYAFQGAASAPGSEPAPDFVYRLIWKGDRATLAEGEHVLGRDVAVSVVLDFPSVSRRHARISIARGDATIEDLGSKNGTFLGDRRVEAAPLPLCDGDKLRVGSVALTFRILRSASSTETASRGDRRDA